jgi:hypothetical protein
MNSLKALVFALPLVALSSPTDEIQLIVNQLRSHETYMWETTIEPTYLIWQDRAETSADNPKTLPALRFTLLSAIKGKTVRGQGSSFVASTALENREITMSAVRHDGRNAVNVLGGWLTLAELDERITELSLKGGRSARNSPERFLHAARVLVELQSPDEELADLVRDAPSVRAERKSLVAVLSDRAAEQLVHSLRFKDELRPRAASYALHGTVSIWVENGELAKYWVDIEGQSIDDQRRVKAVKLKQVTTFTRYDVPSSALPPAGLERLTSAAK